MLQSTILVLALALLPGVLAHGGVLSYSINGQWYQGWRPYDSAAGQTSIQRPWSTFDPITNPAASTISCNDDGQSSSAQLTATVAAGSKITAYWNAVWPHPQGPMLTYLAKCPGTTCTGVNSNSLSWFKIDHAGLLSGTVGNGVWASGQMIQQNNSWTSTIPSTVPPGPYLIRFETIALHSMPAQFYPECAQLQITGNGNREPTASELVKFPGGYKLTDPGVTINLYTQEANTQTQYIIPGPPLYGGGPIVTQPPPSTPPPSSSSSTRPPPSSSSAPPVVTQPPSPGTVAQYGQCGGIGWTGGTACVSPFTCKKLNDYYSQCV